MNGPVHTKDEVIQRLLEAAPELRTLGIARLALFGSFLKGDPHADSDVDLLIEFIPGRKTFDNFMSASFRLEDILQRRVELITTESLSKHIGPYIIREAEYVPLAS